MRTIYLFFFRIFNWKVRGAVPESLKKYVLIVAPHTSNWDFLVGVAARSILKLDTMYVAKKELFRFPFGWFFKKLGGYPVDRTKATKFVDAVCDIFNSKERFSIAITPEGTRSYAPNWKTGFYYIARKLNLPVVMVAFDYANKEVVVEQPYYLTGDLDTDINFMKNYYRGVKGKNPSQGIL